MMDEGVETPTAIIVPRAAGAGCRAPFRGGVRSLRLRAGSRAARPRFRRSGRGCGRGRRGRRLGIGRAASRAWRGRAPVADQQLHIVEEHPGASAVAVVEDVEVEIVRPAQVGGQIDRCCLPGRVLRTSAIEDCLGRQGRCHQDQFLAVRGQRRAEGRRFLAAREMAPAQRCARRADRQLDRLAHGGVGLEILRAASRRVAQPQ